MDMLILAKDTRNRKILAVVLSPPLPVSENPLDMQTFFRINNKVTLLCVTTVHLTLNLEVVIMAILQFIHKGSSFLNLL